MFHRNRYYAYRMCQLYSVQIAFEIHLIFILADSSLRIREHPLKLSVHELGDTDDSGESRSAVGLKVNLSEKDNRTLVRSLVTILDSVTVWQHSYPGAVFFKYIFRILLVQRGIGKIPPRPKAFPPNSVNQNIPVVKWFNATQSIYFTKDQNVWLILIHLSIGNRYNACVKIIIMETGLLISFSQLH